MTLILLKFVLGHVNLYKLIPWCFQIRIQNEAIKKQSTILLSSAAANPQLMIDVYSTTGPCNR